VKTTQTIDVREHLEAGNTLTQNEAMTLFGIGRLVARINDLKRAGMDIESKMVPVINRHGERVRVSQYKLAAEKFDGNQAVMGGLA